MLAPHTDDVELGCGGTIARFLEEGSAEIFVSAFSTADESVPKGFAKDALRSEFYEAMKRLGVRKRNLTVDNYSVRKLSYRRQEILEQLVSLRRTVDPDTVFLPSGQDLHQDHQTIFNEGVRAFKDITMWGYELPWNTITFPTRGFVTLEERHIERKWAALQAYKTQFALSRPYFSLEFVRGIAMVRGVQVKSKYAEAFDVIRERW